MNHKAIKLFGGPQDGAVVEVLHSLHDYTVKMHYPDGTTVETLYVETDKRSSTGEIIFSCYDSIAA